MKKKIKEKKIKITREIYENVKLMIESSNPEDLEIAVESWQNMKPSKLLTLFSSYSALTVKSEFSFGLYEIPIFNF